MGRYPGVKKFIQERANAYEKLSVQRGQPLRLAFVDGSKNELESIPLTVELTSEEIELALQQRNFVAKDANANQPAPKLPCGGGH